MDNIAETSSEKVWFPLRVTYRRELKVKEALDAKEIENFLPMQYSLCVEKGRKVKKLVPVIHNLIFIHVDHKWMKDFKATTSLPICYIMNKETRKPITVPEKQMNDFILVAGTYDEQLIYITELPNNYTKGQKVRIIDGLFKGAEGTFLRIKGGKRLVVSIPGLMNVATALIPPEFVIKIDK